MGERRLLSIADADQLRSMLKFMLDEKRVSLALRHPRAVTATIVTHPYTLTAKGMEHRVDYEPGESSTGLFGGNSNWRGPIWFPVNYLLVESLQKFHHYFGDDFKVEFPTGSGKMMTLWEVAGELSRRMANIFLQDRKRPAAGLSGISKSSRPTPTGVIWSCFTSISTATPARAWAPAIRPDGPAWSPS